MRVWGIQNHTFGPTISNKSNSFRIVETETNNIILNDDKYPPLPSVGMTMDVVVFYDDSFRNRFRTKSVADKTIRGLLVQTNTFFRKPSLTTKLKLNIINIQYVENSTWNANRKTLNQLSAQSSYFIDEANAYIFICSPEEEKDPEVGIAEYKAKTNEAD